VLPGNGVIGVGSVAAVDEGLVGISGDWDAEGEAEGSERKYPKTVLVDHVVREGFTIAVLGEPDVCGYTIREADHVVFPVDIH